MPPSVKRRVKHDASVAPIAPALAEPLTVTMQAAIDSLKQVRGGPLDRAFIVQQIAAASLMSNYAGQLAAVAERPEIQAISATAVPSEMEGSCVERAAQGLDALCSRTDLA